MKRWLGYSNFKVAGSSTIVGSNVLRTPEYHKLRMNFQEQFFIWLAHHLVQAYSYIRYGVSRFCLLLIAEAGSR